MGKVQIMKFLEGRFADNKRSLAILIDPDKVPDESAFVDLIHYYQSHPVDLFLVGGSLLSSGNQEKVIEIIKSLSQVPVVLFPGSSMYLDPRADGILFISLISGRNPEFLIGQHVVAAPMLKRSGIEILPTGYMLVGDNKQTTVAYISDTSPIPSDKDSIAACTALAGQMLGLKMIYLDAGSGARSPVPGNMIKAVRSAIDVPLIVGGGINTVQKAETALLAGADMLVIGNGLEVQKALLPEIAALIKSYNRVLNVHQ